VSRGISPSHTQKPGFSRGCAHPPCSGPVGVFGLGKGGGDDTDEGDKGDMTKALSRKSTMRTELRCRLDSGQEDESCGYGSGQAIIGTLLMLFFGLPSMTRSL
jgi:hypothetical protein